MEFSKLITACLENDPKAWDLFIARYYSLLAHTARKKIFPSKTAHTEHTDIIHDFLLRLMDSERSPLRKYNNFRGGGERFSPIG